MAFSIDQEQCVGCGACESACKNSAISQDNDKYKIGSNCTDCGECTDACPLGCISGTKK